jgi:hypothetical protein
MFRVKARNPEGLMADLDTRLNAAKEHVETFMKGAALLGAAHGAGLIYSLGFLKDLVTSPPGTGTFIVIFGIGLISSIVFYIAQSLSKVELMQALINERPPDNSVVLSIFSWAGALGSVGALISAVGWAMFRFSPA